MDREKAVARCRECAFCKRMYAMNDRLTYLGCSVAAGKWIVEVERCPITEGRSENNDEEDKGNMQEV